MTVITYKTLSLSSLKGFGADGALYADLPYYDASSRQHPSPLVDPKGWRAAKNAADDSYQTLMPLLADWLDEYHGVLLGRRYWEQVAGWFLQLFLDSATAIWTVLNDMRANWPDLPVIGLSEERFSRPDSPRSFESAIRNCAASRLQLATQVAVAMGFTVDARDNEELTPYSEETSKRSSVVSPQSGLWPRSSRADVWLYKTVMRRRTIGLLSLVSGLRTADILEMDTPAIGHTLDLITRAELAATRAETERDRVLLKVLAQLLPTIYIEDWQVLAEKAREWIGQRRPRVIVTGLGSFWSPQFAIWSAECQRLGTLQVGLQHGGCYGERNFASSETHERRISDKYVTWGWSEDIKTVPLPAARLAGISKLPVAPPEGPILWVGTSDSRQVYQLGPRPVGPQFEAYFDEQRRFAAALSPKVVKQILFRPYPVDFGWPNQLGFGGPLPVAVDDLSANYWDGLRSCRMVVVDHVGSTTLLEALVAGRPIMIFGGAALYDIRPAAQPYYDALARVGVYHDSAESAAAELGRIADNITGWWADPERMLAVEAFRARFASSKNFFRRWRNFLMTCRRETQMRRR